MIKPTKQYLEYNEFEQDITGLFPMYIYTIELFCDKLRYKIFVQSLKGLNKQSELSNSTNYINETLLDCRYNSFYNDAHHFLSDELKEKIYDLFD